MKTVRFTIYRKKALSGLFLPNRVYVNGKLAGTIRFGGTLAVEVPKADLYHLTESVSPFDDSAALFDRGDREYRVLLKKVGGRWTRTRYRFHLRTGDRIDPLPAFRFEKIKDAVWENRVQELPPDERLLSLCYAFERLLTADVVELLASESLTEILNALQEIGATQLAGILRRILDELFAGVALPSVDRMDDRFRKADQWMESLPESAWEEFRAGVAKHLTGDLVGGETAS